MKLSPDDLRRILFAVMDGSCGARDISQLVRYAGAVANTFLRLKHQRHRPLIEHAGYDFTSAGQVCVENLFLPKEGRSCHKLHCALVALAPSPDTLAPLAFQNILHRVIALSVEQTIPCLLGESDPQFKKVLRITQDRLRTERFEKLDGFHETWYFRSGTEPRLDLPRFPDDELLAEFSRIARHNTPVAALVDTLFDLLDRQHEYRHVLTVNVVAATVRDFLWLYWEPVDREEPEFDESALGTNLLELIPEAVRQANSKVLQGYIRRQSLAESDARLFAQCAEAYLRDLASSECSGHYAYYSTAFPAVTKQQYREEKRSQFEYYLTVAKNCFHLLARQEISI